MLFDPLPTPSGLKALRRVEGFSGRAVGDQLTAVRGQDAIANSICAVAVSDEEVAMPLRWRKSINGLEIEMGDETSRIEPTGARG